MGREMVSEGRVRSRQDSGKREGELSKRVSGKCVVCQKEAERYCPYCQELAEKDVPLCNDRNCFSKHLEVQNAEGK